MQPTPLTRSVLLGALALAVSATAWGQADELDTRFYVAPMASFGDFDSDISEKPASVGDDVEVDPEDDTGFTVAVGKPLNKYINAEIYYFDFSGVADENRPNSESDHDGFGLAGLFFPFRDFVPVYALAGFGFADYQFNDAYNLSDNKADADYVDYGVGVSLPIPYIDFDYGVRLRAEYRVRQMDVELKNNQDVEFDNEIASVGLVIPLGAPPAEPEPEPEPEPAPEPEPEPQDSDGDGVIDKKDQCPGTPEGTEVDSDGCPVQKEPIVLKGVTFKFNKATLTQQAEGRLDNVVNALKGASEIEVRIEGHTDSKGSASYNQTLSQERADSVKRYLVEHGIDPNRMTTNGLGESQPVAPNTNPDGSDNPEGRAKNRRVELHVTDQ